VLTAAPSASSVFGHQHHLAVILVSAVFGTAFVGIFHANSAGLTRPAFVLDATPVVLAGIGAVLGLGDLSAYGFALAVIGVRLAAKVAEGTLPEMCQAALRTAT
jgi:hypothetical protein